MNKTNEKTNKLNLEALDFVVVGVGGQGTLLASRMLGNMAQALGYDVKASEVHGMSQRGGSVTTYVRMGQKVHAPLIEQKGAHYMLAFEELEALRALPYLRADGTLILNTQQIMPLPVIVGSAEYPQTVVEKLKQQTHNLVAIDALPIARTAGNERAVNTVLMGALAARLPWDKELWLAALSACVPERFMKANMAAFESGYKL